MLASDLWGVGMMFDLKSPDWEQLKVVTQKLVDDGLEILLSPLLLHSLYQTLRLRLYQTTN